MNTGLVPQAYSAQVNVKLTANGISSFGSIRVPIAP